MRKRKSKIVHKPKEFHNDERSGVMLVTDYVTTKKAAEMLGSSQDHIRLLLGRNRVKGIMLGHDWLVFVPSIEKYVEAKSKRGRPPSGTPRIQAAS
jgi:hypothetical protein